MKKSSWYILLGLALVALSAALYWLHYLVFRDTHHIFIYLLGDIAFVPIEVLLVTVIIHRLLSIRAKRSKFEKLNMVIGTFFSDVGIAILKCFAGCDPDVDLIKTQLVMDKKWSVQRFRSTVKSLRGHKYQTTIRGADLQELRAFLLGKRNFLLRLLNNPTLLEHDAFTDTLWAVFHLAEELVYRQSVMELSEADYNHIQGDITRAYGRVTGQWLGYMRHLKVNYPYLFSLAMRRNPFDPEASVTVRQDS